MRRLTSSPRLDGITSSSDFRFENLGEPGLAEPASDVAPVRGTLPLLEPASGEPGWH